MDRDGFTRSVERYQNTVYRLALHILGSPQDADDAVQEVFLRLLGSARQPGEGEHLRRWLLGVTVNYCRDVLKSPWRRRRIDLEELPEQPVFLRPEHQALYETVMALPEKYRTVLYLFYYEELSTREIARLLDLGQSAVTTRLSRARQALKEQLGEVWQDEE